MRGPDGFLVGVPVFPAVATDPLVLTDCTVLTLDPDQPEADAVAFRGGRVAGVGSPSGTRSVAGPDARVLELGGATVLPGFVDCHTHAARLGELRFRADLASAGSPEEVVQVLAERAARTPPGGWVVGWNWDESRWPGHTPLAPGDLARVSSEHNLLARRVCGHEAVVNERALATVRIPEDTPGFDASGALTEDAVDVVWEACAPSHETCVQGLTLESPRLASLGITTIADTAGPRDVRLLTEGTRQGTFLQRAGLYLREELVGHAEALGLGPLGSDRCRLLGGKTYTDGSIGARTAALTEPYADEDTTGMPLRSAKDVGALAARLDGLGLQLKAHAIGDAAVDAVLDGITDAVLGPEARPRLEHAEVLRPDQVERIAALGVVASLQPNFIGNWQGPGGLYEQALGVERARVMNPVKSLLDAGAHLAFSSDGMPYGPLYGIACALAHPSPKERITVEEALAAYTTGAAFALGMEDRLGVLAPGALGDAVVLPEDPRRAEDVAALEVRMTLIDGRVVFG